MNGGFEGHFLVGGGDGGTSSAVTVALTDWCAEPEFGEAVAWRTRNRAFIPGRSLEPTATALFVQKVSLDSAREITAIEFPRNNSLHVFAMTLCPDAPRTLPTIPRPPARESGPKIRVSTPGWVSPGGEVRYGVTVPARFCRTGYNAEAVTAVPGPDGARGLPSPCVRDTTAPVTEFVLGPAVTTHPGLLQTTVTVWRSDDAEPRMFTQGPPIDVRTSVAVLPDACDDRATTAFYGMNAPLTVGGPEGDENTTLIRMMKVGGVRGVRLGFDWGVIEKRPGAWDFTIPDRQVAIAGRHGLEVYGLFGYWTGWAPAYTPEGYRLYAEFCRRLAERYRGRVNFWEVWNEPNIFYWKRGPKEYAGMLALVYPAVKKASPDCTVCAPATAGVPLDWIEKAVGFGILRNLDAVSVHPYRMNGEFPEESDFPGEMDRLRALMARCGGADKRLVISEMEYWTHPAGNGPGVTEREQAAGLVRTYISALTVPGLDRLLWYRFDDPGYEPWNEHHFGVVDPALAPKEAFVALATMTRLLPKPAFRGWLRRGPDVWAAAFDDGSGNRVTVLWTNRTQKKVRLSPAPASVVDLMGVGRRGDFQPLTVTEQPAFLTSAEPLQIAE